MSEEIARILRQVKPGENIFRCLCEHEYQDKRYGKHMRVHNKMVSKGTTMGWRCTVCENVKK